MKTLLLSIAMISTTLPAMASERLAVTCSNENHIADGDTKVDFYFDRADNTWRAVFTQVTFAGTIERDLGVCEETKPQRGAPTDAKSSLVCHDVSWENTYAAKLELGGLAGVGNVQITHNKTVIKVLPCQFTSN